MLAISSSPPMSSTNNNNFGWLLEDPISQQINYNPIETSDNSAIGLHSSSSSQKSLQHSDSNKFDQIINGGDYHNQPDQMVKKLNHNASERDRRRKINSLYSSLRSLLPASEHTKKRSIPSTIARIVKYIPEIQSEVERLIQKKEEITSRTISSKENSADFNKQKRRRGGIESSSLVISASQIAEKEIVFQISTLKINKGSIGEAISELEDEGLVLLNASSFETFEDRVFHTLHFQVEGTMVVEVDMLRDKLSTYFEKDDRLLVSYLSIENRDFVTPNGKREELKVYKVLISKMLAISSSSSPLISNYNYGWQLEDLIMSQQLNTTALETSDSTSQKSLQHCDSSNKFDHQIIIGDDHYYQPDQTVKKLNHNASERDRRRKINSLYSSLRSLLPASDHTKKLSIPSTVSKILTYIPELQNEVERLIQKKEDLTSKTISNKKKSADSDKQERRRGGIESSSFVISANELSDKEVVVQISTLNINKGSFAQAISELEDEGHVLLNASSFETFEDRVFYTLHFQVEGPMVVGVDMLRDKLSSYFDKEEKSL
ncbi:uncharacterized protein LOC132608348 [Lycium barbarum]|uniref:uncharacterized protein LOC132608348 n=1 Tax=Lycium barbarum TaxID=112863 RepID=UPI00293F57E4|nr:uncharacterized protein LOC132608348 [Lycium barbarum]